MARRKPPSEERWYLIVSLVDGYSIWDRSKVRAVRTARYLGSSERGDEFAVVEYTRTRVVLAPKPKPTRKPRVSKYVRSNQKGRKP